MGYSGAPSKVGPYLTAKKHHQQPLGRALNCVHSVRMGQGIQRNRKTAEREPKYLIFALFHAFWKAGSI